MYKAPISKPADVVDVSGNPHDPEEVPTPNQLRKANGLAPIDDPLFNTHCIAHSLYLCDPTKNVLCSKKSCVYSRPHVGTCCCTIEAIYAATDASGAPITFEKYNFERVLRGEPFIHTDNHQYPSSYDFLDRADKMQKLLAKEHRQSMITDKRLDSAVCGIATMIGELDTSTLYAQVQAAISEFETGAMAQFTTWFADVQALLGSDAAGNLLNMITKYKARNATVVLAVADWTLSGGVYACTKSVSIVPANCALHVSPVWASRTAYGDAECGVSAATEGVVTFSATSLPSEALTVNLSVSEVDA